MRRRLSLEKAFGTCREERMIQMGTKRSKEEWEAIVKEYRKSGQSIRAWSIEHGYSEKTLSAHVRGLPGRTRETQRRTDGEWGALLREQASGDMSRAVWCRKNGINADAMRSAERRLEPSERKPGAQEWALAVGTEDAPAGIPRENSAAEQILPDGVVGIRIGKIEIKAGSSYPAENLACLIGKLAAQ
jgi:hypothetical protein